VSVYSLLGLCDDCTFPVGEEKTVAMGGQCAACGSEGALHPRFAEDIARELGETRAERDHYRKWYLEVVAASPPEVKSHDQLLMELKRLMEAGKVADGYRKAYLDYIDIGMGHRIYVPCPCPS
jgi:hypothetical protein